MPEFPPRPNSGPDVTLVRFLPSASVPRRLLPGQSQDGNNGSQSFRRLLDKAAFLRAAGRRWAGPGKGLTSKRTASALGGPRGPRAVVEGWGMAGPSQEERL